MIERIQWNSHNAVGSLPSPFMRGKGERTLRITFHVSSLTKANEETLDAINLLQELGHIPEINAYQTEPGDFPHIVVGDINPQEFTVPVQLIKDGKTELYTGIWYAQQWPQIAARLARKTSDINQDVQVILQDLLVAQAHHSIGGDILITLSPLLLALRTNGYVRETNPCTPLEAAQLVGLFLRSRDVYTVRAAENFKQSFNRGLFYWVLARHRLPSMWRYFSACIQAEKKLGHNLEGLGSAILTRAVRALEARDAIGMQFYIPQNNDTSTSLHK